VQTPSKRICVTVPQDSFAQKYSNVFLHGTLTSILRSAELKARDSRSIDEQEVLSSLYGIVAQRTASALGHGEYLGQCADDYFIDRKPAIYGPDDVRLFLGRVRGLHLAGGCNVCT